VKRGRTAVLGIAAIAILVLAAWMVWVPPIPNRVTADEYAVYSAWLRHRAAKQGAATLYLPELTFSPRTELADCRLRRLSPEYRLVTRLRQLGDARYPLDLATKGNINVPFDFEQVHLHAFMPQTPKEPYWLVEFSRVSFNRSHSEALFAVSNSCGGLCGGGDVLHASKRNGQWMFESTGCSWVY
jgi:hypothetical protein